MSDPSSPKHIIYALVDPNTHQVRYVGQTCKTQKKRLYAHLSAAGRNFQKPVYDWIRGRAPEKPWIVVLQEIENKIIKSDNRTGYESAATAAEIKWMKRFQRSRLFNSILTNSRAYKRLVNQPARRRALSHFNPALSSQ
jgi:hypothetical protein